MTAIAPRKYTIAINGTSFSVTCAIRLIPPIIINPSKTAITAPVTMCFMPKVAKIALEILFI